MNFRVRSILYLNILKPLLSVNKDKKLMLSFTFSKVCVKKIFDLNFNRPVSNTFPGKLTRKSLQVKTNEPRCNAHTFVLFSSPKTPKKFANKEKEIHGISEYFLCAGLYREPKVVIGRMVV